MTNPAASSIIRLEEPLDSAHGGIVAWHYYGNPEKFGAELHGPLGTVDADELYERADALAQSTVNAAYVEGDVPLSMPNRSITDYNGLLRRYGDITLSDYELERWRALVVPFDASRQDLAELQTELHMLGQDNGLLMHDRLARSAIIGEAASYIAHLVPHLHTVYPPAETASARNPVTGVWIPRFAEHLPPLGR